MPLISQRIEALFISLAATLSGEFFKCFPTSQSQQASKQRWQKDLSEFTDMQLDNAVSELSKVFKRGQTFNLPYFREICVMVRARHEAPSPYVQQNIIENNPARGSLHEIVSEGAQVVKMLKTLKPELSWPKLVQLWIQLFNAAKKTLSTVDDLRINKYLRTQIGMQLKEMRETQ